MLYQLANTVLYQLTNVSNEPLPIALFSIRFEDPLHRARSVLRHATPLQCLIARARAAIPAGCLLRVSVRLPFATEEVSRSLVQPDYNDDSDDSSESGTSTACRLLPNARRV